MINHLQPISSRLFSYNKDTRTFSGFISDFMSYNINQLIYDDSYDCGFAMVSSKTGAQRIFILSKVENDEYANETSYWEYDCYTVSPNGRLIYVEPAIKCVIFND